MSVLEIVAGSMLMLSCIIIIGVVLAQEPKGQGLSSVFTGQGGGATDNRSQGKEKRQVRMTQIAAGIFFVLTVLVNVFSVLVAK